MKIFPDKINYTIIDFANLGEDIPIDSKGGSNNPLVVSGSKMVSHIEHPFINLIYSIEDIVKTDSAFTFVRITIIIPIFILLE